jgi:DNA-binding response OmpR family regulator
MKPVKVLYTEDEESLAEIVRESLEAKGFTVCYASTGAASYSLFITESPDIILLDVMLPDTDGFALSKTIRIKDQKTPILFLTSKSLPENVVSGFESGGNDYLKKPFSIEELIIRMKALLSPDRLVQTTNVAQEAVIIGNYVFDPVKNYISYNNKVQKLTSRESEILRTLYINRNRIIERKKLLESMWGDDDFFTGRSLDVFITKLRKHLREDASVQIINVRGVGYKLVF